MTRKFHTRMIILAIAFGCILAATGMLLASPARASVAVVNVFWAGTNCIEIVHVTGKVVTKCGGFAKFVNPSTGAGYRTGVDPIMGAASSISCQFYLDGILEYTDLAIAGDGTDVNCIREILYTGPQNGRYV